jgi:flagellar L-ring protein precursor FlgH
MIRIALALLLAGIPMTGYADSLFTQASARDGTLITDKPSRFKEGDIITVLIRENIDADTTANTNTKKQSDVEAEANANDNSFLTTERSDGGLGIMQAGALPNWLIEAENETRNQGSTTRQSSLTTSISCFVTEVLPNGNLTIQGERTVTINREDSKMQVVGTIRARDVEPNNTIASTKVANAQIKLTGKGALWNNQRRGLVSRFLDWFSPF